MLHGLSALSLNLLFAMTGGDSSASQKVNPTDIFNRIQIEDAIKAADAVADLLHSPQFPPTPELVLQVDRVFGGFLWGRIQFLQGGIQSHPVNSRVSNRLGCDIAAIFHRDGLLSTFPIAFGGLTAAMMTNFNQGGVYAGLAIALGGTVAGVGKGVYDVRSLLNRNFGLQAHFYKEVGVQMDAFWGQMERRGFAVPTEPHNRLPKLLASLNYIVPDWNIRLPLVPIAPRTLREAKRCELFLSSLKQPN